MFFPKTHAGPFGSSVRSDIFFHRLKKNKRVLPFSKNPPVFCYFTQLYICASQFEA